MSAAISLKAPSVRRNEIEKRIDILEDDILEIDAALLKLLLADKTTGDTILWCTKDYEENGSEFAEAEHMTVSLITGIFSRVIQPRAAKSKAVQRARSQKRAEVFTPSWVCNEQNNLIDEAWFGRPNVFNVPDGVSWIVTEGQIEFPGGDRTWQSYVDARRLEITCGEAPYLISRYDTTTGDVIPLYSRIGLFDRKMRVVNENCKTDEEWLTWSQRALWSTYGYEFQGDSVLIARENLLYDYLDYYKARFGTVPPRSLLRTIANIISWNIWQMDGLKYIVPYSDQPTEENPLAGSGTYCLIRDWIGRHSVPFISLLKGGSYGTV